MIWNEFIKEETRKEMVSTRVDEIQNLAIIRKIRRGGKKGGIEEGSKGKEGICHFFIFKFHKLGHCASQIHEKNTK